MNVYTGSTRSHPRMSHSDILSYVLSRRTRSPNEALPGQTLTLALSHQHLERGCPFCLVEGTYDAFIRLIWTTLKVPFGRSQPENPNPSF